MCVSGNEASEKVRKPFCDCGADLCVQMRVKSLFHWPKNLETTTNIWLLSAIGMDTISIHSGFR